LDLIYVVRARIMVPICNFNAMHITCDGLVVHQILNDIIKITRRFCKLHVIDVLLFKFCDKIQILKKYHISTICHLGKVYQLKLLPLIGQYPVSCDWWCLQKLNICHYHIQGPTTTQIVHSQDFLLKPIKISIKTII
jgi:hypothetical protein